MRIGWSGLADVAHRLWTAGQAGVSRGIERLGTGLRINRAMDDAAGLAISEGLTCRINGYDQGGRNAQDGVSVVQTAEGGLATMHDMLQRMRTLAVQAANGTYSSDDRAAMQQEMNSLVEEIDSVVSRTEFNGTGVLDGSYTARRVQVGPDAADAVLLDVARYDSVGLGLRDDGAALVDPTSWQDAVPGGSSSADLTAPTDPTTTTAPPAPDTGTTTPSPDPTLSNATTSTATTTTQQVKGNGKGKGGPQKATVTPTTSTTPTPTTTVAAATTTVAPMTVAVASPSSGWAISVLDQDSAHEAIGVVDDAIWAVSHARADLGAVQNRLERTIRAGMVARDNLDAARSRIRDADTAHEMSHLVRWEISMQAAAAMTSQAQVTARRSMEALLA